MNAPPGSNHETLISLEQLRLKAMSQASRRGQVVAARRTLRRTMWHILWSKVFPGIGLFFCVVVVGYGIGAALGIWPWGLLSPSAFPAVAGSANPAQIAPTVSHHPNESPVNLLKYPATVKDPQ